MAEKDEKADKPIVIKKYANRRLYNTARSSYVTLDHLSHMVRDGHDFVVTDARTGEDITRSVLAQIIFEEEQKGQTMLPANFLRQLIRLYGDTLQGFVPAYLEASMDTFSRNQEKMRTQMRHAFGANPALQNFEVLTRANMELFEQAMRIFTPFAGVNAGGGAAGGGAGAAGEAGEGEAGRSPSRDVELDEMKSQLADMQEKLARLVKDE